MIKYRSSSNEMVINIAGVSCRFSSQDTEFLNTLSYRYKPFLSTGKESFCIDVKTRGPKDSMHVFPDDPIVEVSSSCNSWSVRRLDIPFEAEIDLNKQRATLSVTRSEYCFDSFLRILYSALLVQDGGMLLHAASTKNENVACIMFGVSGSGKTTLAKLSPDTVIGDEIVAVRKVKGKFYAFSTPFWGEFEGEKVNEKAKIRSAYLLKRDVRDFVKPIGSHRAMLEALTCSIFFGPEELTNLLLNTCLDLMIAVRVAELHFRPSVEVFDLLNEGVA